MSDNTTNNNTTGDEVDEATGWEQDTGQEHADQEQDTGQEQEQEQEQEHTSPNAEAAKYRRRLRDTETKLEELTHKHDALLRSTVETMTADNVPAAALWDSGATLEDLLGDDGLPDQGKVRDAAQAAAERYQVGKVPRRPQPVPEAGRTSLNQGKPTWGDALRMR